jgi:hypothetical protein
MCGPDTGRTIWHVQALSFGASHPVRKRRNQIVLSVADSGRMHLWISPGNTAYQCNQICRKILKTAVEL